MKIDDLFILHQGNGFELCNMSEDPEANINFISRTNQNNGVVAKVCKERNIIPFPAGHITVALGGSVLSSFVQTSPFYTAFHIMVLEAKRYMTFKEKLFYCMCIQSNAHRYNYGRQANKTLKNIEIPDSVPEWFNNVAVKPIVTKNNSPLMLKANDKWNSFELQDIFTVKYGVNLELANCEIAKRNDPDSINFVSRTSSNNGVIARVKRLGKYIPQPRGTITCAGGGSVLSTFVQNEDFYSGRDLYLLTPKYNMSLYSKLFCCTIIRANKYRYNYGRQANKTLSQLILKLPATAGDTPDFEYMDKYIQSLPYSDRI